MCQVEVIFGNERPRIVVVPFDPREEDGGRVVIIIETVEEPERNLKITAAQDCAAQVFLGTQPRPASDAMAAWTLLGRLPHPVKGTGARRERLSRALDAMAEPFSR